MATGIERSQSAEITVMQTLLAGFLRRTSGRHRFGELLLEQPGIQPVLGEELGVCAPLHDAARVDHEDHVGGHDRRQPVRDREGRTTARGVVEGALHDAFRHGVEGARGLVENQHRRILEQHPRDRNALLLATRQPVPALPDDGGVSVGERRDGVVDVGRPSRGSSSASVASGFAYLMFSAIVA